MGHSKSPTVYLVFRKPRPTETRANLPPNNGVSPFKGTTVKILSIRPAPPGAGGAVAHFDVEISDDIRLFGLRLSRREAGGHSVYAPNAAGRRAATFSYALVDQIAAAALAAIEELKPHEHAA